MTAPLSGSPFRPQAVGQPIPRVDGPLKVTGSAPFTAEHHPDGLVHGVVVGSRIARGRVVADETPAELAARGEGMEAVFRSLTLGQREAA